jgi:hypothetical protein
VDRPARAHPPWRLIDVDVREPALLQGAAVDPKLGIWTERDRGELPEQFNSQAPVVATIYQGIGMAPLVYGLARLKGAPTVLGMLIVQGGKLWYLDRMVLLFDEMKTRDVEYARWEY